MAILVDTSILLLVLTYIMLGLSHWKSKIIKTSQFLLVFVLISGWIFSGWPQVWQNPRIPPKVQWALAATNTETFTTAGSSSWTAPAGVTSVDVEVWGGGGAGGRRTTYGCGGGGGGGAYAKSTVNVTPGTAYPYTVGAAGTDGASPANGGNSTFNNTDVVAEGGKSVPSNTATGGSGGLASNSTGTTKYSGGSGWTCSGAGGGGGGSGGTGSNGNSATSSTGASAVAGGGPGGNGGSGILGNNGSPPASGPGGGGGGGYRTFFGTRTGGAGYAGQVRLTYTIYTVLGNGTDPSNSSIGPGASATEIDRFSFVDSVGTDTVTDLTVTLGPAGAYNNVATIDVQTTGGSSKCSSSSITSNTVALSSCAISVTTTLTEYKIMITPKTHANMPVPPGTSYDTTATVTDWTGTNIHTGTDSSSATVTIDNASPNGATSVSGSAGDKNVTLDWTTSNSSDFNTTSGSVIYRWQSGSAGSETPDEGSTPSIGSTDGTATVACVVSSSGSTAIERIDGKGGSADCTTADLTNDQQYTYVVFQKDNYGNYDVGVLIGTFTPTLTFSTAIEIRAQNYTTSVSSITFLEGTPGATVSQPYNNIDGTSSPQTFGGAGSAKPVVTLYNSGASTLTIWYNITTFTNSVVANEYYLVNTKGAACNSADDITNAVTFDTNTSTGTTIAVGSGNEKDFYLKITLSSPAGKTGDSTLTILGEAL